MKVGEDRLLCEKMKCVNGYEVSSRDSSIGVSEGSIIALGT